MTVATQIRVHRMAARYDLVTGSKLLSGRASASALNPPVEGQDGAGAAAEQPGGRVTIGPGTEGETRAAQTLRPLLSVRTIAAAGDAPSRPDLNKDAA